MSEPTPLNLADILLKRDACLHALSTDPQAKPELVETLDIPRSTLDDIVRELEHENLVKYSSGTWKLTLLGQYTLEHHIRYKDGLESLSEVAPIIEELPQETPVEPRFLINADVHVAATPVPDEVIHVFLEAVETATHIRVMTPLAMAGYAESFCSCATTGTDSHVEIVLPAETFERLRKLYPDQINKVIDDEDVKLYSGNVPVTFTLWIGDNHAGVIVYADQGVQGILVNDTKDALAWANEQFDRIQQKTELVASQELDQNGSEKT